MFKRDTFTLGHFEGITLGCEELGAGISFVPDHGGTITTLKLMTEGAIKSVLDPISSYHQLVNNREFKNIWLAPFPNRVAKGRYSFQNKDYFLPKNEEGNINALHGFVFDRKFELMETNCAADKAEVVLENKYEGDYQGYPFPFLCTISYQIFADSFVTEISLKNTGSSEMPAGLGWHPYFRLQSSINQTELTLPDVTVFKHDKFGIPLNKTTAFDLFVDGAVIGADRFDSCLYVGKSNDQFSTILYDTDSKLELEIWQDADYEFLQVFTPVHRRSIAIEPMTCAADAYNNKLGLTSLKPGEVLSAKCGVVLKKRAIQDTEHIGVASYSN